MYFEETKVAIKALKEEGYKVYAIEQVDAPILLHEVSVQKDQQYALIMGNEVDGVADEVIALADGVIEIPQFGTKHSFNVSVTMGIVAWEFVKKIKLV
jgi:tRNA G18 (ribose-2'-O)-methylase SpoU